MIHSILKWVARVIPIILLILVCIGISIPLSNVSAKTIVKFGGTSYTLTQAEIKARALDSYSGVSYSMTSTGGIRASYTGTGSSIIASSSKQPRIDISKWNGEAQFSLISPLDKNVEWSFSYQATPPIKGFNETGGIDIFITANTKPSSNKIYFTYDSSTVAPYLQPELTKEEIDEGCIRPDYVVNSIAFYANEKVNYIIGGINYATGKIGHLYRMKINGEWCDWNIEGTYIVLIIPQKIFDESKYPITISPIGDTFGYTTKPASKATMAVDRWRGYIASAPSAGTATGISWCTDDAGGDYFKAMLVEATGLTIVTNGIGSAVHAGYNGVDGVFTESTFATPPSITARSYAIGVIAGATVSFMYDQPGGNLSKSDTSNDYASPTNPTDATDSTVRLGIYCTYTPSPSVVAPTITISAATSVTGTTATLNGNVTATGGENPSVTVYWGDNDGGQTIGNWDSSAAPTSPSQPQGVASFYYNATGLASGTTIYFSAKATNSAGTSWPAASLSFLTIPAAPTGVGATDGTYPDKVTITWTKSTGATKYKVVREATNDSGDLGDVATWDDTAGAAPTITPGTATATDGTSTSYVTLTVSGHSASNGSTESYTVYAGNATGYSGASSADNGYKGTTTLTYQWQRSAADSDASYSSIGGGTTNPYNDTAAPAPTITAGTLTASDGTSTSYVTLTDSGMSANAGAGRYFKCVVSMTGASNQNSAVDRGYIGVGSLTYQAYRSAGDSDASYSSLGGATTNPYNDTTGAVDPNGKYYYYTLSATGASNQDTNHDRGYIAASATPGITNTPSSFGFGDILVNSTSTTGLDYFTVTNDTGGGNAIDLTISGTDMTNGTGGSYNYQFISSFSQGWTLSNNTFISLIGDFDNNLTEATCQTKITNSGTLSKLSVYVTNNTCSGNTVFRSRINGVNGNLIVTVGAGQTGLFTDTTHSDSISANDLVCTLVTFADGSVASSQASYNFNTSTKGCILQASYVNNSNGGRDIAYSASQRYIPLEGMLNQVTTEAYQQYKFQLISTLSKFRIYVASNTLDGTATFRVRINGGNGSEVIAVGSGQTGEFTDSSNTDSISVGDLVNFSVDTAGSSGHIFLTIMQINSVSTGQQIMMSNGSSSGGKTSGQTTYYVPNGSVVASYSTEDRCKAPVRASYTSQKMYLYVDSNTLNDTAVYTLRKNGADTALTVTVGAGATGIFENTSDTVSIEDGDYINLSAVIGGTSGSIHITMLGSSLVQDDVSPLYTWTLSNTATIDSDTIGIMAGLEGGSYNVIVKKTATYNVLKSNLADEATQKWGLELLAPSDMTFYSVQLTGTITLTASLH